MFRSNLSIFLYRLINETIMDASMAGRKFVGVGDMTVTHLRSIGALVGPDDRKSVSSPEWLTIGVLADVSAPRSAASGGSYVLWTLTDLKGASPSCVTLFLFPPALDSFKDATPGSVWIVFNPSVRQSSEKTKFSFSISKEANLIKLGETADLGRCTAQKKSGGKCSMVVNTRVVRLQILHLVACLVHALLVCSVICASSTSVRSISACGTAVRICRPRPVM